MYEKVTRLCLRETEFSLKMLFRLRYDKGSWESRVGRKEEMWKDERIMSTATNTFGQQGIHRHTLRPKTGQNETLNPATQKVTGRRTSGQCRTLLGPHVQQYLGVLSKGNRDKRSLLRRNRRYGDLSDVVTRLSFVTSVFHHRTRPLPMFR